MVNGKPVTDNDFWFRNYRLCSDAKLEQHLGAVKYEDAAIRSSLKRHGRYHHQIRIVAHSQPACHGANYPRTKLPPSILLRSRMPPRTSYSEGSGPRGEHTLAVAVPLGVDCPPHSYAITWYLQEGTSLANDFGFRHSER